MFCKAVAKSNENKADQLIEMQRNRNHWRNAKDDLLGMCLHQRTAPTIENEGNSNDDDKKVADSNVRIEDNEDIAAPFTKCQKLVQADLWFLHKSCMVRNFPSLRKEESSKTLKIEYYTSKKWDIMYSD